MNQEHQQSQIKQLIAKGKDQGFLTYAEVNDHLPEGIVEPDQIEDIIRMINDMGISVHEAAPDAEVFTKCQPMAAVGWGAEVGLHPISTWNNPEPEIVLAVSSRGRIVGATLGNDVNLRDVERRPEEDLAIEPCDVVVVPRSWM